MEKAVTSLSIVLIAGTLSYANPGVLEDVAERRIKYNWMSPANISDYDLLLATPSCHYVGKSARLIVDRDIYTALIVDCAKPQHRQEMIDNGLLADVNNLELVHQKGYLVIDRYNSGMVQ